MVSPEHGSRGHRLTIGRRLGVLVGLLPLTVAAVATKVVTRRADRAVYAAKTAERHRVELAAGSIAADELDPRAIDAVPALP